MQKIKKNDLVAVIAGKDKGKQGKVSDVDVIHGWVKVAGMNQLKKTVKSTEERPGSIITIEGKIDISNVMLVDSSTGKPARIGIKEVNGKKVRFFKKSGTVLS